MRAITYGTFDFCHYGHKNLLKKIKQDCDYLIVGLSTEEFNSQKGKKSTYDYDTRKRMLYDTGFVDMVIEERDWNQKENDIKKYNIDKFYMGSDWTGYFDNLNKLCDVIYLERTDGISSTMLRQEMKIE